MRQQLVSQAWSLSLACPMQLCDHEQITKPPWAMWELDLKLDLQGMTLGIHKVSRRGVPETQGSPHPHAAGQSPYLVCQDG